MGVHGVGSPRRGFPWGGFTEASFRECLGSRRFAVSSPRRGSGSSWVRWVSPWVRRVVGQGGRGLGPYRRGFAEAWVRSPRVRLHTLWVRRGVGQGRRGSADIRGTSPWVRFNKQEVCGAREFVNPRGQPRRKFTPHPSRYEFLLTPT